MLSRDVPSLTSPVLRTYEVGLRFEGETRDTRREKEQHATQIILALQRELRERLTPARVDQAIDYVRTKPRLNGTKGAAHLAHLMQDRSNLGQAAWLPLLNAVKGMIDREKKLQVFLDLLAENPAAAVEWFVLGRTPYLEKQLMYRLDVKFDYSRNLVLAARRTLDPYLPEVHQLTTPLPELTETAFLSAIETFYHQKMEALTQEEKLTENQQKFRRKLQRVYQTRFWLAKHYVKWLGTWNQPEETKPRSRWTWLKHLSKDYHEWILTSTRRQSESSSYVYFSILRGILVSALLPHYDIGKTVNKLRETQQLRIEHLVPKPFQKKKNQSSQYLPLALLMGSKYVVGRPGNNKVLTSLARTLGHFQIAIWPPRQKKAQIFATVQLHPKCREFLNRGARIKLLILQGTLTPSAKLRVSLVLEGQYWQFLSRTAIEYAEVHFCPAKTPLTALGVDINRPGIHMLAFSEPILLPPYLEKLCAKFLQLDDVIAQTGKAVTRAEQWTRQFPSVFSYRRRCKMQGELRRVYKRRKRLLKEIKRETIRFLTSVLIVTECRIFCVEDLSLCPRGTRGALAKAILAMPDEEDIYLRSVLQAMYITGHFIELRVVDPSQTSQGEHMTCPVEPPGKLKRITGHWDVVKCSQCQQDVDTHRNAALKICKLGLGQEANFPSSSSPTAVRIPTVISEFLQSNG